MATFDKEKVEATLKARAEEIALRRAKIAEADAGMREGELADYDQHPADQGSDTLEQEIDATTDFMLEDDAKTVEVALERLREGKYGICIDCGEEIPAARLEAMPEAIRCINDQNIYEGQLRGRGGPPLSR